MRTASSRAWIASARLRRRVMRPRAPSVADRESIVREFAAGKSFMDVGCMWGIDGRICFVAEEAGATAVTGVDLMGRTPTFDDTHSRMNSAVRFVQGDLHDPATLALAAQHDVVWSSGVLYHAPHPIQTLERLRSVTGECLLLATECLPELPGFPGACVFYPALDDSARAAYAGVPGGRALGVTEPFDPSQGYGNWFWGITPSALDGFLRVAGFEPQRRWRRDPFHITVAAYPV